MDFKKEDLKGCLGCLGCLLVVFLLFKGCEWQKEAEHRKYVEMQKEDSIRKAFIEDSLAHDPHYQDSLKQADDEYRKALHFFDSLMSKELAGFILDGDSIYHITFYSHNFDISDKQRIRFLSAKEIEETEFEQCNDCKMTELLIDEFGDEYDYDPDRYDSFEDWLEDIRYVTK